MIIALLTVFAWLIVIGMALYTVAALADGLIAEALATGVILVAAFVLL